MAHESGKIFTVLQYMPARNNLAPEINLGRSTEKYKQDQNNEE